MEAYEENVKRLKAIAEKKGLILNPDDERVKKVAGLMTENYLAVGEYVCPCKQKNKPPLKGKDILCPCPEMDEEVEKEGHCHCRLFYTQERN